MLDSHGSNATIFRNKFQQEQPRKRHKITGSQEKYNNQMIKQTQKNNEARKNTFKVGDMVSI